jgi:hypothetical protein
MFATTPQKVGVGSGVVAARGSGDRDDIERTSEDPIGRVLRQLPGHTGSPVDTNVDNGGVGRDTSADLDMIPWCILEARR